MWLAVNGLFAGQTNGWNFNWKTEEESLVMLGQSNVADKRFRQNEWKQTNAADKLVWNSHRYYEIQNKVEDKSLDNDIGIS